MFFATLITVRMAIYIISDDSRFAIRASNLVSAAGGTAVISESDASSQQFQAELKSAIQSYDFVLLLSENSAKASIEANKIEGVRAHSCRNAEDFEEAREAEANVVVVPLSKFQGENPGISEIISAMLDSSMKPRRRLKFQVPKLPQMQSQPEPKAYASYKQEEKPRPKPKKDKKPVLDIILNKFEDVALPKDYKEEKPERKPDNPKEKKKGLRGLKEKLGVE
jgi:ribose 5-phosphate isomerase RpiB